MHARSSLSEDQREAAVAWFEKGVADTGTASLLGVARPPVGRLYRRWSTMVDERWWSSRQNVCTRLKFKLTLVERFIAGETSPDLSAEAGLSSPRL